ncbi:MAG: nucleotidyltransferase domain-containing protein [Ktedonobacterales bacterium]
MAQAQYPLGRWQPWRPHEVAAFFATLPVPWWIAGGWAIDLFLGRETRPHEDIDILILRRDRQALRSLLGAWDVQAALQPPRDETWPFLPWHHDEDLDETIHDIWCRPDATQPWTIQLMIADTQDDQWLFRRLPSIHRSVATVGDITPEGIPYLVPEIQLLYKAKGLRPKDKADFRQTLPVLSWERRTWLREALLQAHPEHPWLDYLTNG